MRPSNEQGRVIDPFTNTLIDLAIPAVILFPIAGAILGMLLMPGFPDKGGALGSIVGFGGDLFYVATIYLRLYATRYNNRHK